MASSIKAICVMNFAAGTEKCRRAHHPRDAKRNVIKAAIEFPVVARARAELRSIARRRPASRRVESRRVASRRVAPLTLSPLRFRASSSTELFSRKTNDLRKCGDILPRPRRRRGRWRREREREKERKRERERERGERGREGER